MMDRQIVTLVPDYYKKFTCIGSACEDTCCSGWSVDIDQNTYKKYKKVSEPKLKKVLGEALKRNRVNPSSEQYATFKMSEKVCPLLSEDKLCSIQKNLGEEYLSNVCSTYPRVANIVNGILEKSLALSCPEVARLSLLNPDKMEFEEVVEPKNTRHFVRNMIHTAGEKASELDQFFWELRIFTIKVIQNRSFSLSDRLIFLGMFYQKLQNLIDERQYHSILQLIESFDAMMMADDLKKNLSNIPSSVAIQMQLMKELADIRVETVIDNNSRYFECYKEMQEGLQYTEEATVDEISERYKECYQRYYLPLMQDKEYILENYLVSYTYQSVFPHSPSMKVFDEYVMLVVHYALIKLHLIGMAGYHKEFFDLEHVLKLIQSFTKVVEHDILFLRKVKEVLETDGFSTMAYMAILIKN